jgi:hypothetical protein
MDARLPAKDSATSDHRGPIKWLQIECFSEDGSCHRLNQINYLVAAAKMCS